MSAVSENTQSEELLALSKKPREALTCSESGRLRELRTAEIEHMRHTEPARYWAARSKIDGVDYDCNGSIARDQDKKQPYGAFCYQPAKIRDMSKECTIIKDVTFATYKRGL